MCSPKARARRARAAAHHIADDRRLLGADVLEPDRLGIAFQARRDVGQVDRIGDDLELLGTQPFDERAQAISLAIDSACGRGRQSYRRP